MSTEVLVFLFLLDFSFFGLVIFVVSFERVSEGDMVADRIIVIFERVVFWVYWILLFSQYIYRDRWLALVEYGGQTLMALRTPQAYELRLEVLASEKGIVFLLFSSDSFLLCETPGLFDEEDQQCCGGLRNSQTICLSNQVITSKSQRNFFN